MVPGCSEALRRGSDGDAEARAKHRAKHRAVCQHGGCAWALAPIAHADREEEPCVCGHRELRG